MPHVVCFHSYQGMRSLLAFPIRDALHSHSTDKLINPFTSHILYLSLLSIINLTLFHSITFIFYYLLHSPLLLSLFSITPLYQRGTKFHFHHFHLLFSYHLSIKGDQISTKGDQISTSFKEVKIVRERSYLVSSITVKSRITINGA